MAKLIGTEGNDGIQGSDGADQIDARGGADKILGNGGADVAHGGDGDDRIYGGEGPGQDKLYGDGGNDELIGQEDDDLMDGGDGIDIASWYRNYDWVHIELKDGAGVAQCGNGDVDHVVHIENLEGTYYDDVLIGDDGANTLTGLFGNDRLEGGRGDDIIKGMLGDDTAKGGAGEDYINVGAGDDTAVYAGKAADYEVKRHGSVWTVTDEKGGEGTDTLQGVEHLKFADGVVDIGHAIA